MMETGAGVSNGGDGYRGVNGGDGYRGVKWWRRDWGVKWLRRVQLCQMVETGTAGQGGGVKCSWVPGIIYGDYWEIRRMARFRMYGEQY